MSELSRPPSLAECETKELFLSHYKCSCKHNKRFWYENKYSKNVF